VGLAAGKLYYLNTDAPPLATRTRFTLPFRECGAGGHFGNDQPGAEAFG